MLVFQVSAYSRLIVFSLMIYFAMLVHVTSLTFRHASSCSFHLARSMIVKQSDAPCHQRARDTQTHRAREREMHTMKERFFKICLLFLLVLRLLLLSSRSRAWKRALPLSSVLRKKETFDSNDENLLSSTA